MVGGEPSSSHNVKQVKSLEAQIKGLMYNTDEPFQDSVTNYLLLKSLSLSLLEPAEPLDNESLPPIPMENVQVELQAKTRKRKRDPNNWKKNVRRDNRARGKQYINTKGITVHQKEINVNQSCPCVEKCHSKISPAQQKQLFEKFYELGSFNLQTSYLFSLIHVTPKQSQSQATINNQTEPSRRSYTRIYKVANSDGEPTKVCKEFFKNIFQISDGRITRLLKNKLTVSTPPQDQRGRHVAKNKTCDEQIEEVKSFIEKNPTYEPIYTLHKNSDGLILAPDLNISKMYSLYCEQSATSMSYYIFRKIFNEHLNLSFDEPISYSCKKRGTCQIQKCKLPKIKR